MSTFRPSYRSISSEELGNINDIKAKAEELERLYDKVPTGRYRSLAMTALEESVMWIVKGATD